MVANIVHLCDPSVLTDWITSAAVGIGGVVLGVLVFKVILRWISTLSR